MRFRHPLVLAGIGVFSALFVLVIWRAMPPAAAPAAVRSVPRAAQQSALARLNERGLRPSAAPVWAAEQAAWRAPGRYRLFFAAPWGGGGSDIYRAEAEVDEEGLVVRIGGVARLTQTPDGDETAPELAEGWLAFSTRVADRYQSVTCVPLEDLRRRQEFVFARPAVQVKLSWQGEPALLNVKAMLPTGEAQMSIDPSAPRVEPADAGLYPVPARRVGPAWLPG